MAAESPPTASSTFHLVIKSCIAHFALVDLVRISTSSKQLHVLCDSELSAGNRLVAHRLLRTTVLKAARAASNTAKLSRTHRPQRRCASTQSTPASSLAQTVRALEWLLKIAGKEHLLQQPNTNCLASETIATVLQTGSSIPLELAEALVVGGLRVTYPQLFSAACSTPKGLSVWVKAHQRLHIPVGIPSYLASICCGWSISQERLPADVTAPQLADALFLAITAAKSQTHLNRVSHMCRHPAAEDLEPDAVAKLLHAAVVKQCFFNNSSSSSAGNQGQSHHEDVNEEQQLLQGLPAYQTRDCMLTGLCHISAAKQITAAQAAAVLRVAAEAADAGLLQKLCRQLATAVRHLSDDLLTNMLLSIAAKHKYQTAKVATLCAPLCTLPGLQQLGKHAVAGLMQEMIQYKATGVVYALSGLPGARRLQEHVVRLLVEVAENTWGASSVAGCATINSTISGTSSSQGDDEVVGITVLQRLATICGCL